MFVEYPIWRTGPRRLFLDIAAILTLYLQIVNFQHDGSDGMIYVEWHVSLIFILKNVQPIPSNNPFSVLLC